MIRIGIVGCGRILAAHLRGFRLLREAGVKDFQISALCSRQPDDARMYVARGKGPPQRSAVSNLAGDPLAIGDQYLSDFQPDTQVSLFTDVPTMLRDASVDAVVDLTPHHEHHRVAQAVLAAGKHLLSQKPLAVTVAAGRQMCQEADRRGLTLGVFECFRNAPATRYLRWAIQGGPVGSLQMAWIGYIGCWWAPDHIVAETPWRHRREFGGGISLDLGVHFFHQLAYLAGDIDSVSARTDVLEPVRRQRDVTGRVLAEVTCDADDTCLVDFETADGAIGQLAASWAGVGGGTQVASGSVFYGRGGRVAGDTWTSADGTAHSLERMYWETAPVQLHEYDFPRAVKDSFALNQWDWLRAIQERRQPETSGWVGLRDLAAAWAILESAHLGRRVPVADVLGGALCEAQRPLDHLYGITPR